MFLKMDFELIEKNTFSAEGQQQDGRSVVEDARGGLRPERRTQIKDGNSVRKRGQGYSLPNSERLNVLSFLTRPVLDRFQDSSKTGSRICFKKFFF